MQPFCYNDIKTNKTNVLEYLAIITLFFVKKSFNFLLFLKHDVVYYFYIVLKSL